jgi:peptide/nickel transport system ATP-binding protein
VTVDAAQPPLIELKGVSRRFGKRADFAARLAQRLGLAKPYPVVRAVDQVDLGVRKGEVLGLVGESGCGKSTLGRIVAGIIPPSAGAVMWRGRDRTGMSTPELREARLKVQMVFQNPYASLNPRRSVSDIVSEAPRIHGLIAGDSDAFVDEQLTRAGLDPALKRRYPHQFSGGQRQRIGIARALAVDPEFIVCDEAVAALDVSIQAQIINLFMDLRDTLDLTYLFISHDLGVVRLMADRIAVMYLGKVAEYGTAAELFGDPRHPYTEALLAANPDISSEASEMRGLPGTVPDPANPPEGCRFHTRCAVVTPACGWEVDDAVAWLQKNETLLTGLTDVERRSNFDATLVFQDEDAASAVRNAIHNGDVPPAMKAALGDLTTEDRKVHISFVPVEPVELEDIGGGHLTACILYTSRRQPTGPPQSSADSTSRTAANASSPSTTNSIAR